MELNNILGNFRKVDTNWFPIVPEADVAIEVRSPKYWIDEYAKLMNKYNGDIKTKEVKAIRGGNRRVAINKPTETKIENSEELEKQLSEDTKKFLIDNVITNWKNIELNGEQVEYSKENAEKVFDLSRDGVSDLLTSLILVALDINNFTEANSYNPEDEESVKK